MAHSQSDSKSANTATSHRSGRNGYLQMPIKAKAMSGSCIHRLLSLTGMEEICKLKSSCTVWHLYKQLSFGKHIYSATTETSAKAQSQVWQIEDISQHANILDFQGTTGEMQR